MYIVQASIGSGQLALPRMRGVTWKIVREVSNLPSCNPIICVQEVYAYYNAERNMEEEQKKPVAAAFCARIVCRLDLEKWPREPVKNGCSIVHIMALSC